MKRLMFGLAVAALLAGCNLRTQTKNGILSTRAMNFDTGYEIDRSQKISGADRAHGVWIIPFGSPDADAAVEATIEKANKTSKREIVGLADAEVKFRFLWLYVYSQRWYDVEGCPIYKK